MATTASSSGANDSAILLQARLVSFPGCNTSSARLGAATTIGVAALHQRDSPSGDGRVSLSLYEQVYQGWVSRTSTSPRDLPK